MGPGPTPPLPNLLMVFRPSFAWQTPRRRPPADPSRAPALPKRGAGAAHARLSGAEQRRGGVPQSISMVCGNVTIELKESVTQERMPRRSRSPSSCSRWTKTGPHHVAPTNFEARTRAALRMQERALLQKMIDDPLNPVDSTMAPALTAGRRRAQARSGRGRRSASSLWCSRRWRRAAAPPPPQEPSPPPMVADPQDSERVTSTFRLR